MFELARVLLYLFIKLGTISLLLEKSTAEKKKSRTQREGQRKSRSERHQVGSRE